MIENATYSVDIFTPYLDFTINKLIQSVSANIEVTIITSLEGDTLFQKDYQINALIEAMNNGVVVKNLKGLHAKILMVDKKNISLGSQNFTNRGRKNKEAGFISIASFENSDFLISLESWIEESTNISLELLENLKRFINDNEEEISDVKERFNKGVEEILSDFYNTTYRFAQGSVIVTKTVPPPNRDYFSFFAGEHNNLCKWIKTNKEGTEEQVDLNDYDYHPSLNLYTMQMAFLRIHTSRITFIKTNFKIYQSQEIKIGGEQFDIEFKFLRSNTKKSNIKISLVNEKKGKGDFYYLFNGFGFRLVKYKNDNYKEIVDTGDFSNEFLTFLIEPAKFKTPWNQPKEIEKFLPKEQYKVGILQYEDCPVLIFEEY